MKKILTLLLTISATLGLFAQSPKKTAESKNVKITYGQPSVKGREIFGKLVPFGQVWRTGANEATEVTFAKDVTVAGTKVKAGTYSLFTIPTAKNWTVILNSELKQWGSYDYDKIKGKNVASVEVPSSKLDKTVEALTITTDDKTIGISWDKTAISVPLAF